ncbi:MAG TPA: FeoA family protein [Acidobacteriaceae bacterium]|jgi:ferrous iron transport protein A|nr:FeoA family protein [Acidobacteriaceae bacterium]
MALSDLRVGQSGTLEAVELPERVSDHLAHLGFLPGASVEVLRRAPAGDPTVYRIDGVEVALRSETARHITVELAGAQAESGR